MCYSMCFGWLVLDQSFNENGVCLESCNTAACFWRLYSCGIKAVKKIFYIEQEWSTIPSYKND